MQAAKSPTTSMFPMNIPIVSLRNCLFKLVLRYLLIRKVVCLCLAFGSYIHRSQLPVPQKKSLFMSLQLPPRSKSKFCAVTSDFSNTPSAIWATYRNFCTKKKWNSKMEAFLRSKGSPIFKVLKCQVESLLRDFLAHLYSKKHQG